MHGNEIFVGAGGGAHEVIVSTPCSAPGFLCGQRSNLIAHPDWPPPEPGHVCVNTIPILRPDQIAAEWFQRTQSPQHLSGQIAEHFWYVCELDSWVTSSMFTVFAFLCCPAPALSLKVDRLHAPLLQTMALCAL